LIPAGIPAGAGTTAMFYITTRRVTDREGYLFRDFFKSFKANFKQSALTWMILSAVGIVLAINIYTLGGFGESPLTYLDGMSPTVRMLLYYFQLIFFLELIFNTLYVFVIIARFDMKIKESLKTSVFMVHKHLLTTAMLVILFAGVYIAGGMYPLFYVIAPAAYAYVTSYLFIKIFKKYRPEIDENPYIEIDKQYEERLRQERIDERKPISTIPAPVTDPPAKEADA